MLAERMLKLIVFVLLACATASAQTTCPCDCDADGRVSIAELVRAVNIALGQGVVADCPAADQDGTGRVAINELILGVNAALDGCFAPTRTPTATPAPTSTPAFDDQNPPTNGADLLPWLEAGTYLGWTAESAIHPSAGPHTSNVLTYLNDSLITSLSDGAESHPEGAATVKELWGNGSEIQGWAVSVKTNADSGNGAGWYWYEKIGNNVFADGNDSPLCYNCHAQTRGGVVSKDFVLTPFPLQ